MAGETAAPTTQAPAPAEGAQPQGQHHINRQPRAFNGRVNGPPAPAPGAARAPAPGGQEPPPSEPPPKVKVKYKVNGAFVEEELDHETLANRLSREKASYGKFEEAAKLRQQAEKIQKDFVTGVSDPKEFRKRMTSNLVAQGMDPSEAQARVHDTLALALADVLDEADLSPQERELRELRQLKEERQQAEKDAEAQQKHEAFSARVHARAQDFTTTISKAFETAARGGLPVNEKTLAVMGEHYLANMAHGVNCTPEELVQVFEQDLDQVGDTRFSSLGYEGMKQRYPGVVKMIHAGLRAEAQSRKAGPPRQVTEGRVSTQKPPAAREPVHSGDIQSYLARHRQE